MAKNADLRDELQAKYGCRPRNYRGFFNSSCEAEWRFVDAIPAVAGFLNKVLESEGLTVHECEVAVNFISEGGYLVLDSGQVDFIDGYSSLGIDTLVDNYKALKPYLHPMVQRLVDNEEHHNETTNERGEKVTSLTDLTLEEGLYANAGMYAWSKVIAANDIEGETKKKLADQDIYTQFYWTTVYYNAGPGTGRKLLKAHGLGRVSQPWDKADDQQYNRDPHYNASWRSSSFEYLLRTVYASGSPSAWVPAAQKGYLLYGVVNLSNSPAADYTLALLDGQVDDPSTPPPGGVTTGRDGRFELESATPGPKTLVVSRKGKVVASLQLDLKEKVQQQYIELTRYLPTMTVAGSILDKQGKEIDGVKVALYDSDGNLENKAVTEYGGQFSLQTYFPGTKKLVIESAADKAEVTTEVNQQYVMVSYTLGSKGLTTVTGTVSLSGQPLANVWIELAAPGGGNVSSSTDLDGKYKLLTSAQGEVQLAASPDGAPVVTKKVVLTGGEQTVDFKLQGLTIKGKVTATDGSSTYGYQLVFNNGDGSSQSCIVQADGSYELSLIGTLQGANIRVYNAILESVMTVELGDVSSSLTKDITVPAVPAPTNN